MEEGQQIETIYIKEEITSDNEDSIISPSQSGEHDVEEEMETEEMSQSIQDSNISHSEEVRVEEIYIKTEQMSPDPNVSPSYSDCFLRRMEKTKGGHSLSVNSGINSLYVVPSQEADSNQSSEEAPSSGLVDQIRQSIREKILNLNAAKPTEASQPSEVQPSSGLKALDSGLADVIRPHINERMVFADDKIRKMLVEPFDVDDSALFSEYEIFDFKDVDNCLLEEAEYSLDEKNWEEIRGLTDAPTISSREVNDPSTVLPGARVLSDDRPAQDLLSFTPDPGLTEPMEDLTTPRHFFDLVFTSQLIQLIVSQTNVYAQELQEKCNLPKARIKKWVDLTTQEFMVFLGMVFHMGTIQIAHMADYWNTDSQLFDLKCFRQCMSRDRFMSILSCLHFAPNPGPDDPPSQDRLFRIRPLIDIFNNTMDQIYVPEKTQSKYESMILRRGRLLFQNSKTHSYDIKMYMLNECTGMVLRFMVYAGAADVEHESHVHAEKIVYRSMDNKLFCGSSLTMDNYPTSVSLVHQLLKRLTCVSQTVRPDHVRILHKVESTKLSKGECMQLFNKDRVCVMKWNDKRDVLLISSEYSGQMIKVTTCQGNEVEEPEIVAHYNDAMAGVDKDDYMMSYYPFERKPLKWYIKLGVHVIHLFLVNAYFLYVNKFPGKSIHGFRLSVIKSLLPPSPLQPLICKKIKHYPERIGEQLREKVRPKYRRCRLCQERSERKETKYFCPGCSDSPPICVYPCFRDFHKKQLI